MDKKHDANKRGLVAPVLPYPEVYLRFNYDTFL